MESKRQDGVKFDLSHGFPPEWGTSRLEKKILTSFLRREQYDLVVNATWGMLDCLHPVTSKTSNKFEITRDLIDNHGVKNMLFFNFVDPLYDESLWYPILQHCANKIGRQNVKTLGFIDTNKFRQDFSFQFWAVFNSLEFKVYFEEELMPEEFKNLYLCYNRKPTFHRKWLFEQFEKNKLLSKGIFTLGNENPDKVMIFRHDTKTVPFINDNVHGNYNIPNDTLSLGPIDDWRQSFLIIVTETDHNRSTAVPFLSEKIWKPLIGLRPFLVLGDKGTIRTLRDLGFETFNDFFGIGHDDAGVDEITRAIKNYAGNMYDDFEKLKPKLYHNRNRYFDFVEEQKKLLWDE